MVSAFKALVGLKRQLGFHTSKDDIALQPSRSDMQTAMTHMVLQMLEDQGWYSLQQGMLLSMLLLSCVYNPPVLLCLSCFIQISASHIAYFIIAHTMCDCWLPDHLLTCIKSLQPHDAFTIRPCWYAETPFLEPCQGSVTTCAYLSILDIAVQCQNLLLLTLQIGKAGFDGHWPRR